MLDRIEPPLTSRKDFETTSSLNSLRQSVIQRSSESGKQDVTTRSLFPPKTNSETVHLQTSRSLFQFQSSAESSAQMTTAKSGHYTTTQKSVTSKQSHDQTSSFKLQTSRTFYESSTANRQYSSTVSGSKIIKHYNQYVFGLLHLLELNSTAITFRRRLSVLVIMVSK